MSFFSKFRTLSPADYYLLIWASLLLPLVGFRLRIQGFKKVYQWATAGATHRNQTHDVSGYQPGHVGKLVNFVAIKGVYRAKCLCRSLVLLKLLSNAGLNGELRIGIPKNRNNQPHSILDAHAWVELHGVVINDRENVVKEYAVFELSSLD